MTDACPKCGGPTAIDQRGQRVHGLAADAARCGSVVIPINAEGVVVERVDAFRWFHPQCGWKSMAYPTREDAEGEATYHKCRKKGAAA